MASPSERALITGSSGFTGRALSIALKERGYTLFGLSNDPTEAWEHRVDLTCLEAVEAMFSDVQPQLVVHLAGVSSPVHGSVPDIYQANVVGSAVLLAALRRLARPPRLVLAASSATVYARRDDGRAQREGDPLEPASDYAVSKMAMEQMCRLAQGDLPIRVVRPFNYTGVGQTTAFLIPKIVDHFARGAGEITLGNLDLDRDISSLEDTIEAYVRLAGAPPGAPLNLCSGKPVRLSSIVDLLREISGRPMQVRTDPRLVRAGEPRVIVGDRSALDAQIGSWPRQSMRVVLEKMYASALAANEPR